ncbi:hypothetical protein [Actinotalea sp.]|uniref:hypothetical protein n=1 Tax=Actinotalea sp. TaxID=1872145 RepID=UPI00356A4747
MRRVRSLAAVLALSAGLAACAPDLPTPDPEALPAMVPVAVGDAQVSRILGEVTATLSAADAELSGDALAPRVTGTAAEIRAAQYVQAAAGAEGALTEIPATPQTVIAPATDTWPRTIMVVTTAPVDLRAPLLLTLVQDAPRSPYSLVSWARLFPGTQMPATAQPELGSDPVASDSTATAVSPTDVLARYVDVLSSGAESEHAAAFADDPLRNRIAQQREGWTTAVGEQGSVTETYEVLGDSPYALATADGGAIVVGSLRTVTTINLVDSTLTVGAETAALLGGSTVSTSLAITWDSVVAFFVPPAGSSDPITVLGGEHAPVSVTGS